MARFIPIDKMKQLREAARNGDERAKLILKAQLNGDDFSASLDEYFAPKPEPQEVEVVNNQSGDSRLEKFLADNGISKDDPEYNDAVHDFYEETGAKQEEGNQYVEVLNKLIKSESEAIDDYSKAVTSLMNDSTVDEITKKRAIARFKEIRGDEEEHFKQLSELLKSASEGHEPEKVE